MADQKNPNWHRVCLNTIVRKGVELESERLRILPMGSRVNVVEKKGRRVRIDQPINGWCSLLSSTGDVILSQITNENPVLNTPKASNLKGLSERVAKAKAEEQSLRNNNNDEELRKKHEEVKKLEEDREKLKAKLEASQREKTALQEQLATSSSAAPQGAVEFFRFGDIVRFPQKPDLGLGIVRFYGKVNPALCEKGKEDKMWIGVEFDQELGDSNGVVQLPDGTQGGFPQPVPDGYASFVGSEDVALLSCEVLLRKLVQVQQENEALKTGDVNEG